MQLDHLLAKEKWIFDKNLPPVGQILSLIQQEGLSVPGNAPVVPGVQDLGHGHFSGQWIRGSRGVSQALKRPHSVKWSLAESVEYSKVF